MAPGGTVTISLVRTTHGNPTAVVRAYGQYQLVVVEHVCAGKRLFTIDGERTNTPTRYSVQIDRDLHIDIPDGCPTEETLDRFFWRFTNHSCEPTAVIRGRDMTALRCIEPWQQITFNYNTTEYDMAEPFDCGCGSPRCEGTIRGFRWLEPAAQQRIRPMLSSYLATMLNNGAPNSRGQLISSVTRHCAQ
jgi:hypothetical protein